MEERKVVGAPAEVTIQAGETARVILDGSD